MVRTAVVGAAVAALFGVCGAATAHAAPIEAYGALPSVDQPALSPDGDKVAYVLPDKKGLQGVQVVALNTGAVVVGMPGTQQKVRGLVWADPQHLIILKSQTGQAFGVLSARSEWYMAQVVDLAKRRGEPLLNADRSSGTEHASVGTGTPLMMNVIEGVPQPRTVGGRTLIYVRGVTFKDRQGAAALFAVAA